MKLFDVDYWDKVIRQKDWYGNVPDLLQSLNNLKNSDSELYEQEKTRILTFFIDALNSFKVSLGKSGEDQDKQRESIDTIIIHHTGSKPGMTPDKLSALELIRLYAPVYAKAIGNEGGKPIYSNHFRDNKMVFWPYHWIIRNNGTAERLLRDNEIGWHAGDWSMNCRSIAVALDNDYENSCPSKTELMSIAQIIVNNYPNITTDNIIGHREVNPTTICPSNKFLGEDGWKKDLLETVEEISNSPR